MKRTTYKTIEYDYTSVQEFQRHAPIMFSKGWGLLKEYDIEDGKYVYHAIYATGKLYNGINGR